MKIREQFKNINIISLIITLLSILVVVLYPCLYVYFHNIDSANFSDITRVISLFSINALIIFFLVFLNYRNTAKAGLLTNIAMLFILLFGLIEKGLITFLPMLYYWHIVMLVLTIIVILGIVIKQKMVPETANKINIVMLIIFGALVAFNAITAMPILFDRLTEVPNETNLNLHIGTQETKTNFYYFIFDEYGGLENLERYTGYDNTPFYNSLEELGFNVSKNSKNNTIFTSVEVPNLLNLEVVNNTDMTYETKMKALEQPYLFLLFKENGYQLNIFSDQNFLPSGESGIVYDYTSDIKIDEVETIEKLILNNSIYYPSQLQQPNQRLVIINKLFQYAESSCSIQHESLFTFGYFMFPHMPFVADEFGNMINQDDMMNSRNSNVYLGQLKYCSKKIIEVVEQIIKTDPEAIIIIQSDHGFRQPMQLEVLFGEKVEDMELEMKYERNILNAVYYKGEILDIESLSGLNTLITAVNKYFGLNFEFVEQVD